MDDSILGEVKIKNTQVIINEINEFIHLTLDKKWMSSEWKRLESGVNFKDVHPLVNVAFKAHRQIQEFMLNGVFDITPEIFELSELAIKINNLKRNSVKGLEKHLQNLTSHDFTLYRTARYEIQIAGMLIERGHMVNFIDECGKKTPDILVSHSNNRCEIECKHKDPQGDQMDYVRSIYNSTQTARKQFSKTCAGIITIDVDKNHFEDFKNDIERLKDEIFCAMRFSSSISAILLTSKIFTQDENDYIYRHRVKGFLSSSPRYPVPKWLMDNLVNVE
jgi:hypothetical protein